MLTIIKLLLLFTCSVEAVSHHLGSFDSSSTEYYWIIDHFLKSLHCFFLKVQFVGYLNKLALHNPNRHEAAYDQIVGVSDPNAGSKETPASFLSQRGKPSIYLWISIPSPMVTRFDQ